MAEQASRSTEPLDAGARAAAAGGSALLLLLAAALGAAAWLAAGRRALPPPPEFPAPRLQSDPPAELRALRERQRRQLSEYAWVDRARGTIRIPIERAMALVAERGLPHRSAPVAEEGPP